MKRAVPEWSCVDAGLIVLVSNALGLMILLSLWARCFRSAVLDLLLLLLLFVRYDTDKAIRTIPSSVSHRYPCPLLLSLLLRLLSLMRIPK